MLWVWVLLQNHRDDYVKLLGCKCDLASLCYFHLDGIEVPSVEHPFKAIGWFCYFGASFLLYCPFLIFEGDSFSLWSLKGTNLLLLRDIWFPWCYITCYIICYFHLSNALLVNLHPRGATSGWHFPPGGLQYAFKRFCMFCNATACFWLNCYYLVFFLS